MAGTTRTFATLELSQSAYDEIERKLLDAGYEHLFERGPGSEINMRNFWVARETSTSALKMMVGLGRVYCFMCDSMVSAPCKSKHCLQRISEQVRNFHTASPLTTETADDQA